MNSILNKFVYNNPTPAKVTDVNLDGLRIVISFSLYGNIQKYLGGLIENCNHINKIYPDFWIYVYLGNDFDRSILNNKFDQIKNILFIETEKAGHEVMSYRFFAIDRPEVGIAFSRDADSRINTRDQYCISEFLKSPKKFQIIRDSPSHGVEILGGMWGIKKGINLHIQSSLKKFKTKTNVFKHGTDQDFLAEYIYPRVRDHSIVFDGFFRYRNEFRVTIPLPYDEHVGAPIYLFYK
jgi:hypothetical protein